MLLLPIPLMGTRHCPHTNRIILPRLCHGMHDHILPKRPLSLFLGIIPFIILREGFSAHPHESFLRCGDGIASLHIAAFNLAGLERAALILVVVNLGLDDIVQVVVAARENEGVAASVGREFLRVGLGVEPDFEDLCLDWELVSFFLHQ